MLELQARFPRAIREGLHAPVVEEAVAAGVFMTDLMLNSEEEWVKKLEAEGVSFNRDVDIPAFQEKTAVTYTKFPDWTPGLYEKVREILDN